MRRWAIINGILAIMVALLGLEIVRTWGRVLPPVEVGSRQPQADQPREKGGGQRGGGDKNAGGRAAQQTPAVLVAAIGDKDLFDPSRKPPAEEAAPTAPAPIAGPPTNLTVAGVRISGKNREAFVTDSSQGNRQQRLHVGDQVAAVVSGQPGTVNYTIKTIDPTGLTLASPSGDTVSMPLEVDKSKAAGTPAAPGRPGVPPRPGQPAAPPAPPAAGAALGASPAAGVPVPVRPPAAAAPTPPGRQPVPPAMPPGVVPGGQPGTVANQPGANLPPEVRQKIDQLKGRKR